MEQEPMLLSQQRITPKIRDLWGVSKGNLRKWVPKKNLYWVGSGREGLRQILLHLKEKGIKNIGVPRYACQVVLDSVKRAGCEPVFYDSGVVAEVEEIEKIIDKIDSLLVCYNFGFLPKIDKIVALCNKNKVILIEDCAQALGANYKNKLVGSFGDYTFYSFGISKNIGFCGGLVASDEKMEFVGLKKFPWLKLFKVIMEVKVSGLFFNKHIYSFSRKFLSSELKKEQEVLDYKMPGFGKKVILSQVVRYDEIWRLRRKNGEYCLQELEGVVDFIRPATGSDSAWLYFVIFGGDDLQKKMLKEGVELGRMKTFKCLSGEGEKALDMEKKVLTFAMCRDFKEIKFMVDKIKKVVRNE